MEPSDTSTHLRRLLEDLCFEGDPLLRSSSGELLLCTLEDWLYISASSLPLYISVEFC